MVGIGRIINYSVGISVLALSSIVLYCGVRTAIEIFRGETARIADSQYCDGIGKYRELIMNAKRVRLDDEIAEKNFAERQRLDTMLARGQ